MAILKPRAPRKLYLKNCLRCKREWNAFRQNSKYCSDSCRIIAFKERQEEPFRNRALKIHPHECMECGKTEGRMYVWQVKDQEDPKDAIVVCGLHHTQLTQTPEAKRRREQWLAAHPESTRPPKKPR